MRIYDELRSRTRHDAMLEGNNSSYLVAGHFPREELERILPDSMAIPDDEVMAAGYPTMAAVDGMHPFVLMFSNCSNVHDVFTGRELRPYRELMFFIPVAYRHENEEQLCSYVPVLYLEYLLGVIGGLYLGLRKEFHPGMKDVETATSKSFVIEGILDARFEKAQADATRELDPFFTRTLGNPTVTVSRLRRTRFYTTKVYPTTVLDTSAAFEWHYEGSAITDNDDTFANYAEYRFTTSQAMGYDAYFHPKYAVPRISRRPPPR